VGREGRGNEAGKGGRGGIHAITYIVMETIAAAGPAPQWAVSRDRNVYPPSINQPYAQPPSVHQTVVVQPAVLWQSQKDAEAHTMASTNTMDMVDFLCELLCTLRSETYTSLTTILFLLLHSNRVVK